MLKNNKESTYFIINEIITLILNVILYQLLVKLNLNIYVSSIIAFLISLIINYNMCKKLVFCTKENSNHTQIKFLIYDTVGYIVKHYFIKIIYYRLSVRLILAKPIGFVLLLFYDYITKKSIFDKTFKLNIKNIKKILKNLNNYWIQFTELKYIHYLFKILPKNILIFIFFIASIYYSILFLRSNNELILYNQTASDSNIGAIINERIEISFKDIQVTKNVDRVCLIFGTYQRENNSNLLFELYNDNSKIFDKKINTNILNDGQNYCINTPEISEKSITDYKLIITSSNADEENSVTIFTNKETNEYTISLRKINEFNLVKYLVIIVYIIVFLIINYLINTKKLSENKFLLLMFIYFISILFIYPPMTAPDEGAHFYRAYNLSQNGFESSKNFDIKVPEDISCLSYAKNNYNKVDNFKKVTSCLENANKNVKMESRGVANYATGYIPQTGFLKIADLLTDSSLFIFYFGRIGNLITAFLILYFAVKMAPTHKKIILFIGLIPMFIQQSASYSYDAILNSFSLLYIAYIIKHIHSKDKLGWKDTIIPIIYFVLILTIKVIYFPLMLLIFFIPREKFDKKFRILYYSIIFITMGIIYYVLTNILFTAAGATSGAGFDKQLNYLLSEPLQIIPIAINTIKTKTMIYIKGVFGSFAWFDFDLSDFTILCCLLMYILLILSEKNIIKCQKKVNYKKLFLLSYILISIAGIFASMYLCWSDYKLSYVEGVQGRYFIPLMGAIALVFIPNKPKIKIREKNLYMFINILLIQYIVYSIIYFY